MDSEEADEENNTQDGKTLLAIFKRGSQCLSACPAHAKSVSLTLWAGLIFHRDCIGDCCVAGDLRWGGSFGVSVDLVALSHCAVQIITMEDLQVTLYF